MASPIPVAVTLPPGRSATTTDSIDFEPRNRLGMYELPTPHVRKIPESKNCGTHIMLTTHQTQNDKNGVFSGVRILEGFCCGIGNGPGLVGKDIPLTTLGFLNREGRG